MTNTIPVWTTVDDEKVTAFPEPWNPHDEAMIERVRVWAENTDDPWLPTTDNPIDETLRHWQDTGVRRSSFDGARSASPELKRFTADVLRYRKGLLAATLPDGLVHYGRYTVREEVSYGYDVRGREVYVVGVTSVGVLVALVEEPYTGWPASTGGHYPIVKRWEERFGNDDRLQWVNADALVPIIGNVTVPEPPAAVTATALDELSKALERAQEALDLEKQRHQADVEHLLGSLKQEAEDRGWCPDYERFLGRYVEGTMNVPVDVTEYYRERTGYAQWEESYTVVLTRRRSETTVWSHDHAQHIANDTDAVDGWIRRTLNNADQDSVYDVSVEYDSMDEVTFEVND